jgi:hypothetical protein
MSAHLIQLAMDQKSGIVETAVGCILAQPYKLGAPLRSIEGAS